MIEINGATEVAATFAGAAAKALPAIVVATGKTAEELKTKWRAGARRSSGSHGRRYPSSITSEKKLSALGAVAFEVGPERGKPQGAMGPGFEYGSRNQPPHLDGKKAADAVEPGYHEAIEAAVLKFL